MYADLLIQLDARGSNCNYNTSTLPVGYIDEEAYPSLYSTYRLDVTIIIIIMIQGILMVMLSIMQY